jgi:phosphohistidine swiveling domain-containing protein
VRKERCQQQKQSVPVAGPPATTAPFLDRLRQLIQEREWVKGAVNYDEDLHFSTYYLRASCARNTAPLYPGYTQVIAFYEGFTEFYYLLRSECLASARAIVEKALRRPAWLPRVVQAICRRSDRLAGVFRTQTSPDRLARLSDPDLRAPYFRHAARQRALYRYARLPEALDRGVSYFSTYLVEHLRQRGLAPAEAEETFAVLSQPVVPSVLAQEMLDFEGIVAGARASVGPVPAPADAAARARMFLRPELVQRLRAHQEKWQFLPYHGYGRRELATLGRYVERLAENLSHPAAANGADLGQRYEEARRARQEVLGRLDLDPAHRALFEVYPEIGAAKLYRRYAQLRNFYYLDMLLAEIAHRIGVSEWTLRCMLPEEVAASLESRRLVDPAIPERTAGCLYAIIGDEEQVVAGGAAAELHRLVQARLRKPPAGGVLRGVVASRGKAVGRCKVIIRADDYRADLAPGTIVASESTDPDLVDLLKHAAGVLTEQGGVTSHAAIICRELGIPTIIGIEGLLDRVRDGDVLEVDAERGIVTPLGRRAALPESPAPAADPPEVIGAKAFNLGVVRSLGFAVPDYVVLPCDRVRQLLHQPGAGGTQRFLDEVLGQINLSPGDKLAVRSSAANEDGDSGSLAGKYRSVLNIDPNFFWSALCEFLANNQQRNGEAAYRGSVIVQRMIVADCAGVCLTSDPRTGQGNAVIIEWVAGGNQAVTGGVGVPDRLVVDRLTGDIRADERRGEKPFPLGLDLAGLVRQFLTLEARFGKALDIEWAVADGRLYILQARPIVSLS